MSEVPRLTTSPDELAPSVPLLEVRDLTIRHEQNTVLDGLSFDVVARSIHLIVGPNGAGKSSLLSAMLGLSDFDGTITCHFRRSGRIGFVPQSFGVDKTMPITVEEFLALTRQALPVCLGLTKGTRARVHTLLELVGLSHLAKRRLGALSGGELRRVLLANAVDPDPELLLLDEPSTGLDRESIEALEKTLRDLRAENGLTAIVVTHDEEQVKRLADAVTALGRAATPSRGGR